MRYQGSKSRLVKSIVPILQQLIDENKIETYIEPFVGSAAVIQEINCKRRIGSDANSELIALLNYIRDNPEIPIAPQECSFEHYKDVREARKLKTNKYSTEYTALIGYTASYGGRYFDGGYGRQDGVSVYKRGINNLLNQAPYLKGIEFNCCDYKTYKDYSNCLFYLDPPYKGTKGYLNGTYYVDYDEYYDWIRNLSKNNIVVCSEYSMPEDFKCIWEQQVYVNQKSDRLYSPKATERLFIMEG